MKMLKGSTEMDTRYRLNPLEFIVCTINSFKVYYWAMYKAKYVNFGKITRNNLLFNFCYKKLRSIDKLDDIEGTINNLKHINKKEVLKFQDIKYKHYIAEDASKILKERLEKKKEELKKRRQVKILIDGKELDATLRLGGNNEI